MASKNLIKRSPWQSVWFHLSLLAFAAVLFSLVPRFASGLPLSRLLSSDAEFFAHTMRLLSEPSTIARAEMNIDVQTVGARTLNRAIGLASQQFNVGVAALSIYLSIFIFVLYIFAVYAVGLISFRHRGWGLFLALVCIVPIHVLGGTSLGFQALGLLPRDLALVLCLIAVAVYVAAVQRNSLKGVYLAFLLCGLFGNYYTLACIHLGTVLALAEVFRLRKPSLHFFGYAAVAAFAALPAIIVLFSNANRWTPVEMSIMRMRNGFMIASPIGDALLHYLRRFIIHSIMAIGSVVVILRFASEDSRRTLRPWLLLGASSLTITIMALFVEARTEYLRLFFSRASIIFTLAAMVLTISALRLLADRSRLKASNLAVVAVAGFLFAIQSNLGTIYRYISALSSTKGQKTEFFKALEFVEATTPPTALILVPSPEMDDQAASLRTYANRRVYVAYKDGGISLVDGKRAREWLKRYENQAAVLASGDPKRLSDFMKGEGIDFAFLPNELELVKRAEASQWLVTAAEGNGFQLVRPHP